MGLERDLKEAPCPPPLLAVELDVADSAGGAGGQEAGEETFATTLLGALATMAMRSKRRQADLAAALTRSGLKGNSERIGTALRHLEHAGCIEDLVPLYDGGMLLSVTSRGIEHVNAAPRWTMFDSSSFHGSPFLGGGFRPV